MTWTEITELIRGLPPWAVGLGIAFAVVLVVLLAFGIITLLGSPFRRRTADGDSHLTDDVRELRRSRAESGSIDGGFDRLVRGTMLGISPDGAAGTVLLVGALAATASYLFNFDELLAAGVGLAAGALVMLVFYILRNRRRQAIQEQLPDGCFQLARSLRAGLNLPDALLETTAYTPVPLARLFDRLTVALTLGESTRRSALRVSDEARVTDFDLFTEVLILNSESGGNLPAMLDRLAVSIRDRNQYRGFFRSVTALSRITAIFLALAMPAALLIYRIFQPEMLWKFLDAREGQLMMTAAVILEILGIIWIAFLLRRQDDY